MKTSVLIVETEFALARIWASHLQRMGAATSLAQSQEAATVELSEGSYDVVILNLNLLNGSALAVADYASYRWPETKIIFVSSSSFFSDGSVFNFVANACTMVPQATRPEDLAAMVDYYGR